MKNKRMVFDLFSEINKKRLVFTYIPIEKGENLPFFYFFYFIF